METAFDKNNYVGKFIYYKSSEHKEYILQISEMKSEKCAIVNGLHRNSQDMQYTELKDTVLFLSRFVGEVLCFITEEKYLELIEETMLTFIRI